MGQALPIHEVSRSHKTTHHSRWDSSGRVIRSSQRPLPDITQYSQQTNIHAPGGIRWEDNIKMDLQEVGGGRGEWMELAQDSDRWRTLVGTVRDFRVP